MVKEFAIYNITQPLPKDADTFETSGASTVALAMAIYLKVVLLATSFAFNNGKRRRRGLSDFMDTGLVYKVMNQIDSEDCIALEICYLASIPDNQITVSQEQLLKVLNITPQHPESWSSTNGLTCKYKYAGLVGHGNKMTAMLPCRKAFPNCRLSSKQIEKMSLTTNTSFCSDLDDIFNSKLLQDLPLGDDKLFKVPKSNELGEELNLATLSLVQ